jgi:hypothetical protein
MSSDFYTHLPPVTRFRDVANLDVYTPVPDDWYIVLTDVRGSTQAIQQGRYKEVNIIGAAAIVVLLNLDRTLEIPYVFGGDGATILIPPELVARARLALPALSTTATTEFQLTLRTALVPMHELTASEHTVLVAKLLFSENFTQAAFAGGGLTYAEQLVKNPATAERFLLAPTAETAANLEGLECRWQNIPSRHGETVSLLVTATGGTLEQDSSIYRDVIGQIEEVYGQGDTARPLEITTLFPTFSLRKLSLETRLRTPRRFLSRLTYIWKIWFQNWLLLYFWRNQIKTGDVQWDKYVELLIETSDYRKYDDTLRMVLSGTPAQREALSAYLEQRHQEGALVYGIHVSQSALVTCAVFERMGRQVHFIDGADGGYALAAKALKAQLKSRAAAESDEAFLTLAVNA